VALPPVPVEPRSEPGDEATTDLVQEALEAVEQMDGSRLEKLLMRSAVVLEPEPLVSQLILPLLRRMGTLWEHGNIGPAQEHVASAAIRSFLGWLIDAIRTPGDAPLLICGTPAGHRHDLGALLSCVVGADAGWRTVYLGPDLPSDELALAARRLGARALALSAIYPSEDPNIPHEFATLLGLLPGEVMVFAGGPAVEAYRRDIEQLGGRVVGSLSALREALVEVGGVGAADEGVLRGWLRSRTDGPDVGRRQG
jgi:methanogenic corrinoid protein MtbC1